MGWFGEKVRDGVDIWASGDLGQTASWQVSRSIDWLIDGSIAGSFDRSIDWLIDWAVHWSSGWLIVRLIELFIVRVIDWLIDWLTDVFLRVWCLTFYVCFADNFRRIVCILRNQIHIFRFPNSNAKIASCETRDNPRGKNVHSNYVY